MVPGYVAELEALLNLEMGYRWPNGFRSQQFSQRTLGAVNASLPLRETWLELISQDFTTCL
jgi:hypothetical protein